ncbi:hypothetical protein BerOc1_02988 [Pseudodesulfovibrio hydrargyri]|uniref:Phage tail assembly chaperone-like domain-containing protein n=1 Tax=Pseudodesulfovibrio hydrargyri TaxID=2125990 RepID=A0A1J5N5Z8_9BACT|nr:tail fiber assembly protein [Pseudodesulfovibrio hydrargyri]OIQ51043.1 hypothetical protein BerOc1_02988 [Pseudodesulfovibrio hydrargyri]
MKIITVSQFDNGHLVNGAIHVPYDENNRHYRAVMDWLADGGQLDEAVTDPDEPARIIRAERDRLLAACDWMQLADSPLDTATKAAWAAYRQALRDVPEQPGFPEAVEWPQSPILPA